MFDQDGEFGPRAAKIPRKEANLFSAMLSHLPVRQKVVSLSALDEIENEEEDNDTFPLVVSREVENEFECALSHRLDNIGQREPTMRFTVEEFAFVNYIKMCRNAIIGRIGNAYYDPRHREELTAILMSRGQVKPSFTFMDRLNKSIVQTSMAVMDEVLSLFNLSERAKKVLKVENMSYASLVGAAVFTYGNNATTFVEQAKQAGMSTMFVTYLEENGLADVVPRMESSYLNPSPWAEKEVYEIEFDDIMKKVMHRVING